MNLAADKRNFFRVSRQGNNSISVNAGRIMFFNPLGQKIAPGSTPEHRFWEATENETDVSADDFDEITASSKVFLKILAGGGISHDAYLFDFGTGENIPAPAFHYEDLAGNVTGPRIQALGLAKRYTNPEGENVLYTPEPTNPDDNQEGPNNEDGVTHILIADIIVDIDDETIINIKQYHVGPVYWMPFDILYGDGHVSF